MKKTLVLAALALGLWAFWRFYEVKGGAAREKAKAEAGRVFPGFDPGSVTGLSLRSLDGGAADLQKSGQDWELKSPLAAKADASVVRALLQQVQSLDKQE